MGTFVLVMVLVSGGMATEGKSYPSMEDCIVAGQAVAAQGSVSSFACVEDAGTVI